MTRPIAVVFHSDYSSQLRELAFRTPVWVIETAQNRAAAEAVWMEAQQWPHLSVTVFRAFTPADRKDEWRRLLEQIELHHGPKAQRYPYDTVQVLGAEISPAAREAFEAEDFGPVEVIEGGFRATKRRPHDG